MKLGDGIHPLLNGTEPSTAGSALRRAPKARAGAFGSIMQIGSCVPTAARLMASFWEHNGGAANPPVGTHPQLVDWARQFFPDCFEPSASSGTSGSVAAALGDGRSLRMGPPPTNTQPLPPADVQGCQSAASSSSQAAPAPAWKSAPAAKAGPLSGTPAQQTAAAAVPAVAENPPAPREDPEAAEALAKTRDLVVHM